MCSNPTENLQETCDKLQRLFEDLSVIILLTGFDNRPDDATTSMDRGSSQYFPRENNEPARIWLDSHHQVPLGEEGIRLQELSLNELQRNLIHEFAHHLDVEGDEESSSGRHDINWQNSYNDIISRLESSGFSPDILKLCRQDLLEYIEIAQNFGN